MCLSSGRSAEQQQPTETKESHKPTNRARMFTLYANPRRCIVQLADLCAFTVPGVGQPLCRQMPWLASYQHIVVHHGHMQVISSVPASYRCLNLSTTLQYSLTQADFTSKADIIGLHHPRFSAVVVKIVSVGYNTLCPPPSPRPSSVLLGDLDRFIVSDLLLARD